MQLKFISRTHVLVMHVLFSYIFGIWCVAGIDSQPVISGMREISQILCHHHPGDIPTLSKVVLNNCQSATQCSP